MVEKIRLTDDQIAVIRGRIDAARTFQAQRWENEVDQDIDGLEDRPQRWLALVGGNYWRLRARANGERCRRYLNKILPKLQTMRDIVTAGETQISVEAQGERFVDREQDIAAYLMQDWQGQDLDGLAERVYWDMKCYGYGVAEVQWLFVRGKERKLGERGEPMLAQDATALAMQDRDSGVPEKLVAYEGEAQAEAMVRMARIDEDREIWGNPQIDDTRVERFCPRHLLVDPCCTSPDLSDARYAIRVRYEQTELLKRNKSYSNTKDLRGAFYNIRGPLTGPRSVLDDDSAADLSLVRLYDGYHFLDIDGDGVEEFIHVIMAEDGEKPLVMQKCEYVRDDGQPLFPVNPFPFRVHEGLNVDNDCWMGESAIEQAAPAQISHDEAYDQAHQQRIKSPRLYLMRRGLLDAAGLRKFQLGEDLSLIEVDDLAADDLVPLPQIPLPGESVEARMEADTEIGRAVGVSQFQESVMPDRRVLKAEIDAVNESGGARVSGDTKRYRKFRQDIAECLLALHQKFGDRTRSYSFVTDDGERRWGAMNATELRGTRPDGELEEIGTQYRLSVRAESVAPGSKAKDKGALAELLTVLQPFMAAVDPGTGAPLLNVRGLIKQVLDIWDWPESAVLGEEKEQPEVPVDAALLEALVSVVEKVAPEVLQRAQEQGLLPQVGSGGQSALNNPEAAAGAGGAMV